MNHSVQLAWSASTGNIAGGDVATWQFEPAAAGSPDVIEASATVTARDDALGRVACELWVYVAKPTELPKSKSARSAGQRSATLSARAFLLPDMAPEPGYGLYSYLLFDTPPNGDEERQRYLKAIEAYLLVLQPLEEMERHRRRSELNLTLLPVKRNVQLPNDLSDPKQATQAAQRVLAAYDYARAQVLLADLGWTVSSGPYLVSKIAAGSDDKVAPLSFDMSHVMPQLVWDWVRAFCALTAQEHSWTDVTLTKLALNTRNIIAVGARATPDVVSGLEKWIRVAKPR
ncbi:hypothetical protein IQ288_31375 [Burkholderia sp. R-69980]|nr:hypothetical protein [Burkholderia sp. R-69980]